LLRFLREEEGQGLAEYALILVLISIIAIAGLSLVGDSAVKMLASANSTLTNATT
jgi:Flp pilus assembly pilin Flp